MPCRHFAPPTPRKATGPSCSHELSDIRTELYRDPDHSGHFLTIDRWRTEQEWRAFRARFGADYDALDARLDGLATVERSLFEGVSEP
jgi:hypothetical protein